MLLFFFSTKQRSFPSLHISIIPTKHTQAKTKSFQSSHFPILSLFSTSYFSISPTKQTLREHESEDDLFFFFFPLNLNIWFRLKALELTVKILVGTVPVKKIGGTIEQPEYM